MKACFSLMAALFFVSFSFAGITVTNTPDTSRRSSSHPIRFLSFSAAWVKNDVLIEFSTPSESIASKYNLESSTNGIDWKPVVSFANQGAFNPINKYDYKDKAVQERIIYYRVKQTLNNVMTSFSPVIYVKANGENENVRINGGANNSISLYFPQEIKGNILLQLHSLNGQFLFKKTLERPSGNMIISPGISYSQNLLVTITDGQNFYKAQTVIFQ
jgi:hypothetical protein